jgi:hypothetical protein
MKCHYLFTNKKYATHPLKNRHQIEFTGIDDLVEKENTVRFVDAFVDTLYQLYL